MYDMNELPSQPILGLIDGVEVLQILASTATEISGAEISRSLKIEKTKVNRILKTLAYQGFAEVSVTKKYRLGPAIHVLSAQILHGSSLIKNALKYLIELTDLNVVVAMGVLWRDKVAYTYHWEPGLNPIDGLGRVDLFPATQSSIGLVLLSEKSNKVISEIIDFNLPIPGFNSKKEFMNRINEIRKQGFGYVVFEGRVSVSVMVGSPARAAVAFAAINDDVNIESYISVLKEKIDLIEKAM